MKAVVSPGTPWRNLLVVGLAIFLTGSSFNCTINLLSTINITGGLGTAVNGVIFGVQSLSSMTLPPILINRFGAKITFAIGLALYIPYIAGNLNPIWEVYIPLAVLVGFGAGLVWPSVFTLVAALSKQDSDQSGRPFDQRNSLYFGVFYMFFTISNIAGNLVSYYVLRPDDVPVLINGTSANVTEKLSSEGHCGINFCDSYATENSIIVQPPAYKIHLLTAIFMCVAAAAALTVLLFVDPVESEKESEETKTSSWKKLKGTFKLFGEAKIILLLPITLFTGIEYSFMASDFTKAYVGCTWGVEFIGLVTMVLGVSASVCSCSLGIVARLIGRVPVFLLAVTAQTASIIILWVMDPFRQGYYLFYIVAIIWGLSDTVWQAQIKALYGTLFPKSESEAYSLLCCVECSGFVVGFACSAPLCTLPKLCLLSVVLTLGLVGYGVVEYLVRLEAKFASAIEAKTVNSINGVAPVEVYKSIKE